MPLCVVSTGCWTSCSHHLCEAIYQHPQHRKVAHHNLKDIWTDSRTAVRKTARNWSRGLEKQDLWKRFFLKKTYLQSLEKKKIWGRTEKMTLKSIIYTNQYTGNSGDLLFFLFRNRWWCSQPNVKQEEFRLLANQNSKDKVCEILGEMTDRNCENSINF